MKGIYCSRGPGLATKAYGEKHEQGLLLAVAVAALLCIDTTLGISA